MSKSRYWTVKVCERLDKYNVNFNGMGKRRVTVSYEWWWWGFGTAVTDISFRHAWLFIYLLGHVLVSSHGAMLRERLRVSSWWSPWRNHGGSGSFILIMFTSCLIVTQRLLSSSYSLSFTFRALERLLCTVLYVRVLFGCVLTWCDGLGPCEAELMLPVSLFRHADYKKQQNDAVSMTPLWQMKHVNFNIRCNHPLITRHEALLTQKCVAFTSNYHLHIFYCDSSIIS